jgi:hypothetical protein
MMKTMRDRSLESDLGTWRGGRRKTRRNGKETGPGEFDRMLRTHSGTLTFLGLTLGVFVSKKFFMIPLAVAASLGQDYAKDRFLSRRTRS